MHFTLLVGAVGLAGISVWPQPLQTNPYRGLFEPSTVQGEAQPRSPSKGAVVVTPRYKIVCGTVVFEADPNIDPKIRIPIPKRDVKYAIRIVPRRECR
jgi:hypothetical protein